MAGGPGQGGPGDKRLCDGKEIGDKDGGATDWQKPTEPLYLIFYFIVCKLIRKRGPR